MAQISQQNVRALTCQMCHMPEKISATPKMIALSHVPTFQERHKLARSRVWNGPSCKVGDEAQQQQLLKHDHACRAHSSLGLPAQDECSQDVEELRQQLDEACGTIANLQDDNDRLMALIPGLEERIKSTEAQVGSSNS